MTRGEIIFLSVESGLDFLVCASHLYTFVLESDNAKCDEMHPALLQLKLLNNTCWID